MTNCLIDFLSKYFEPHDVGKFISTMISGGIFLWIGFWQFRRQERFKSSTNEVKGICSELANYIKLYQDMRFKCERLIDRFRYTDLANLVIYRDSPGYNSNGKSTNRTLHITIKAFNIGPVSQPVPDLLNKTTALHDSISWLHNAGINIPVSFDMILSVLQEIIDETNRYEQINVQRAWSEFDRYYKQLVMILKFHEDLCTGSVRILYTWDTFTKEITKFEPISQRLRDWNAPRADSYS